MSANPYAAHNPYEEEYEMNEAGENFGGSDAHGKNGGSGNGGSDDFVQFMSHINEINSTLDDYEEIINKIDNLHKQVLTEVNEENENILRTHLNNLISQATDVQYTLKDKIKNVQKLGITDASKQAQAENSRQRFLKLIQDYRIIDSDYKEENKQQAARQYKVIQPDATDAEVEEAITDVGGQQIFSQALLNANRRGEAKTALAEVQARHQELLQLEKTMAELTQLFNDMEQLVIEQQENIDVIDQNIEDAQQDVEQGIGHTNKAVKSARNARKNKMRCYIVIFLICLAIVIAAVVPSVVATQV